MRIAIGGLMHESNTFAPLPADRRRFEEGSFTRWAASSPGPRRSATSLFPP